MPMSADSAAADLPALLAQARRILTALRVEFDRTAASLAQACAIDGRLDAARLDERQLASYELALASADLLAAETAVGPSGDADAAAADADAARRDVVAPRFETHDSDSTAFDIRLALAYAAEAIGAVVARLQAIGIELDLDPSSLDRLASDAGWRALRRAVASGPALDRLGADVAAGHQEVGHIAFDEPLALAQDAFRRFAADVVAPQAEAIHRDNLTVPEALLQSLRELGVFGLSIPERYGGSRPDDRDDTPLMLVVTEALSEASLAAAGSLITRPEILARALLAGGTEAQRERWLPRLAAGDPLCAIAITEPDYGSDVASLALRASRTDGGWRLDGAKTWCTFAGKAGLLMVVARTNPDRSAGHRGLSILLVEKPSTDGHAFEFVQPDGGRLVGTAIPTIGYRGMHSFDLAFEGFFVPAANVVGEEAGLGKGFYFTMAGMMGGRMQTAARACGVMRAALRAAIRYAGDRRVFGAALADYPLTRAKLAQMAARYAACRHLAYRVGGLLDAGGGRMEASLVKLLACRSAELVTREALQIHGGMGYAEESPVSRYFVDARVLSIFEGAEETLALKVVARSLLEDALASTTPAREEAVR
jgi:(2S)-methylsuccinyl-CoA dehydrogenase